MKRQRNISVPTVKDLEPNSTGDEFRLRWLERLGLQSDWREAARTHLEKLCFVDSRDAWPLIESLFETVPRILNRKAEREELAEAYAWCCYAFWQCESGFPAFPETFAFFLLDHLQSEPCQNFEIGSLLASLFANPDDPEKWGGFNHPELKRPEVVRRHEALVKDGRYEEVLHAWIKYDEYERKIQASADLKKEWAEIKKLFPAQIKSRGMIHRSLSQSGIGCEVREQISNRKGVHFKPSLMFSAGNTISGR
jgi:hypothetical protein